MSGRTSRLGWWITLWGLVCTLTTLAYWPGLPGLLVFDDAPVLGPYLRTGVLHHPFWSSAGPLGRPVSMASFWLDRQLWPHSLFAMNLTNVFFHLITGTFACLLAHAIFRQAQTRESTSRWAGFWIGAFFLIEPMQVATVLYTVQRMAILAALFTFSGLWCYFEARTRSQKGQPAASWFLLALLLCPLLAVFSKENGALAPVLALAAELIFFHFHGPKRIQRLLIVYFGALSVLALVLIGRAIVERSFILAGFAGRGFTLGERLLTESRVLIRYLLMPFLPTASRISFFHDDLALSHSLVRPLSTAFACLALTLLLALALALWKRRPLVTFGIAWFFIGQLLESTFIPLEIMFVHRNYLPVFGLLVAAADGLRAIVPIALRTLRNRSSGSSGSWLARLAPLPIWMLFAVLSLYQASLWSHPFRFYRLGVQTHPLSATAVSGLAQVEFDRGEPRSAMRLLGRSGIVGAGLQADVYRCRIRGRLTARELSPTLIPARAAHFSAYPITTLNQLAILGLTGRCAYSRHLFLALIERAQSVRSLRPHNRFLLSIYLGYENERLGRLIPALNALEMASIARAGSPLPWILGARWLLQGGKPARARRWLERGRLRLSHAPALKPAWMALAKRLDQTDEKGTDGLRPQPESRE